MEVDSLQIVLKSAFAINWGQCGQIDGVVILFEKGEYSFFSPILSIDISALRSNPSGVYIFDPRNPENDGRLSVPCFLIVLILFKYLFCLSFSAVVDQPLVSTERSVKVKIHRRLVFPCRD